MKTENHVNVRYFENKLKDLDMSQREVSRRMNLHYLSFHKVLKGERKLQIGEAFDLAALFRVPVTEIFEQVGYPIPLRHNVPIRHEIIQGKVLAAREPVSIKVWDAAFEAIRNVDGGQVYLYKETALNEVSGAAVGRLAVVKLESGHMEVGKLSYDKLSGKYQLARLNNETVTLSDIKWANPVEWIQP
ncbi:helix-turn-helix domain-containing protein [Maritalea mediterranea]|uniref:Helix-turn-helix transcriptional regulator n=1 Tax=Maritalea mediterranea TaxID=2909667 RepID=A0ABS9E8H4_9HYPH|nr:helix-turn-helix transcriptional regulator [Maritalea mediterranea]MCF4098204.1 helix-turn-helix transcriptional regulator [Maritalea mediterranea]